MHLRKKRHENFPKSSYEYRYRVGRDRGLVCMKPWPGGEARPETSAVDLGLALQLTNILRDIKVDAALGRIYIPQAGNSKNSA